VSFQEREGGEKYGPTKNMMLNGILLSSSKFYEWRYSLSPPTMPQKKMELRMIEGMGIAT